VPTLPTFVGAPSGAQQAWQENVFFKGFVRLKAHLQQHYFSLSY
jgi:hypothetical protein